MHILPFFSQKTQPLIGKPFECQEIGICWKAQGKIGRDEFIEKCYNIVLIAGVKGSGNFHQMEFLLEH